MVDELPDVPITSMLPDAAVAAAAAPPVVGPLLPVQPIGPAELGLPPAPVMPTPPPILGLQPPAPLDFKRKLLKLALAGTAIGMGPVAGGGLLRGAAAAEAAAKEDEDKHTQLLQQELQQHYGQQQQLYTQQSREYDAEANHRQAILTANLEQLRKIAPTLKTKDLYDSYVNAFSAGLQQQGIRIQPEWLRNAVPYVAPLAKDQASKTLDLFLKNPANKAMIEQHPEQIGNIVLRFDRDGDGIPENVKLTDLAMIAEQPFATDATGKLIVYPKGTSLDAKANADARYEDLLRVGRSEGKDVDSATGAAANLRNQYRTQALKETSAAEQRPPRPVAPGSAAAGGMDLPAWALDASRPAGPEGNTFDKTLGLTPNALYQDAITYMQTFKFPPTGMGSSPRAQAIRSAVQSKVGAIAADAGMDVPTFSALYKANAGSLAQTQKFYDAAQSFLSTADKNSDLLEQTLTKIPDTGSPLFNSPLRDFSKKVAGDPNLSAFNVALQSVQNEYGKILNNPNLAGQLSDSARREAQDLVSPTATVGQIVTAIQTLKAEGTNRLASIGEQLRRIQGRLSTGGVPVPPPSTDTTTAPPAANTAGGRPAPNGQTTMQKYGATYVWNGFQYVKQP